jgi:hypothetical protein
MSVKMDPSFATLLVGCLTAFVTIAGDVISKNYQTFKIKRLVSPATNQRKGPANAYSARLLTLSLLMSRGDSVFHHAEVIGGRRHEHTGVANSCPRAQQHSCSCRDNLCRKLVNAYISGTAAVNFLFG